MSLVINALKKKNKEEKVFRSSNKESKGGKKIPLFIGSVVLVTCIIVLYYYNRNETAKNGFLTLSPGAVNINATSNADSNRVEVTLSEAGLFNEKGIDAFKSGNLEVAESYFKLAISKYNGKNSEVFNNIGMVLLEQNRAFDAKEQFVKALKIKESFPEAINNLALAYEKLNNLRLAEQTYQKVLSSFSDFPDANLNYAVFLDKKGLKIKAQIYYKRYLIYKKNIDSVTAKIVKSRIKEIGVVK